MIQTGFHHPDVLVDGDDLLCRRLGLAVAGDDGSLLGAHHELGWLCERAGTVVDR